MYLNCQRLFFLFSVSVILISLLNNLVFSEEVGVFKSNSPLNSNTTVSIVVPSGVVGLSGDIPISGDSIIGTIPTNDPISIFFVIDNSGTMSDFNGQDIEGNRFKIVKNILDTLVLNQDRFPNIECGFAVFGSSLYHNETNSSLLKYVKRDATEKDSGTYLPLIELNKKYPEAGNQTGKDIINDLLAVRGGKLTATASYGWISGTNISMGFEAAVEAMAESSNPKANQYIIFISDGERTVGSSDFVDGYMNGMNDPIPTTFTIYFTKDGVAPDTLKIMTENIKSNGYSTSNSLHTYIEPYNNTSLVALVDYMMENIVSVFGSSKITKPSKIEINGNSSETWNSIEQYFTFPHPLALTGQITEYNMDLSIKIAIDSIAPDSSIIDTTKDSVFTILTKTIIDNSLSKDSADGEISWWDRNLNIFRGNTSTITASALDNALTIKFDYDPLQSGYEYKNADISVRCVNSKDSLKINCTYVNNNTFEGDLNFEHLGAVSFSDNKITPDSLDEIIITFRNSESYPFPLDTIEKRINYTRTADFVLEQGALFDDNSDGFCDKIILTISGDVSELSKGSDEIASNISLPTSRSLTIDSTKSSGNLLALFVSTGENINTGKNSDDFAIVSSNIIISTGGILRASSVELIDSMAPVCTKATLNKNGSNTNDSLSITFSEIVQSIESIQPFVIISQKGYNFEPKLESDNKKSNSHSFIISKSASDSIIQNDSLYISIIANVDDTSGNIQNNPLNKRVPINVNINGTDISITNVIYFDPEGKGFPSLSEVTFSLEVSDDKKPALTSLLKTYFEGIEIRDLKLDSIQWINSVAKVYLTESNGKFITAVLEEDKFINSSPLKLSDLYNMPVMEIMPIDSMAPVSLSATLYDNPLDYEDSLIVAFSEEIKSITSDTPFVFYNTNNEPYKLALTEKGINENSYTFTMDYLSGDNINEGDSLNINPDSGIVDLFNNSQLASNNKKVEITIIKSDLYMSIEELSFHDPKGEGYPSIIKITSQYELTDNVKSPFKNQFVEYIESLDSSALIVDSSYWNGKNCVFVNSRIDEKYIKTIVSEDDKFIVSNAVYLSDNVWLEMQGVSPLDSMAPVLIQAICVDSIVTDSIDHLIMKFSENIENPGTFYGDTPYQFKQLSDIFTIEMNYRSHSNSTLLTVPTSRLHSSTWENVDSVRIYSKFGITDGKNPQMADKNRMVELEYMNIAPPLELKLEISMIDENNSEAHIIISPIDSISLKDGEVITGKVTILDHVGNIVIKGLETEFNNNTKESICLWDGKNSRGRTVGSGVYLVFVIIDPYTDVNVTGDFDNSKVERGKILKGLVGVKY